MPDAAHATTLFAEAITAGAALLAGAGAIMACRVIFSDVLDRIAAVMLIVTAALASVFALGQVAASIPTPLLNVLLLANPVVGVASAAHIDIFHTPLLYELSPIAHREFQYPAWPYAAALYGCVGVAAIVATRAARERRAATNSTPTH